MADASDISGLYLFDETGVDVDDFNDWFEESEELFTPISDSPTSREVIQYGQTYQYGRGRKIPVHPFDDFITSLRDLTRSLVKSSLTKKQWKIVRRGLDQCIVNKYIAEYKQGISAHIDQRETTGSKIGFKDVIACWTFAIDPTHEHVRSMQFKRDSETIEIPTSHCSLYVMSGNARYEWKHSMPSRKTDRVNGERLARQDCVSITFRTVI